MARRRKKDIHAFLLFTGAVVLLTLITVNNPGSVVAILFILLLIGVISIGGVYLWNKIEKEIKRAKQMERVKHIQTVPQMRFLSPNDFEHYVATIYEKLGHDVTVTKQSGDEGIDIILKSSDKISAMQVKRYTNTIVGRPELQKLVGASLRKFDKMILVTTTDFSREATEYATLHNIDLINGEKLARLAEYVFGPDYINKALQFGIFRQK